MCCLTDILWDRPHVFSFHEIVQQETNEHSSTRLIYRFFLRNLAHSNQQLILIIFSYQEKRTNKQKEGKVAWKRCELGCDGKTIEFMGRNRLKAIIQQKLGLSHESQQEKEIGTKGTRENAPLIKECLIVKIINGSKIVQRTVTEAQRRN